MKETARKAAIEKQMAQLDKELKSIESSAAYKKARSIMSALTGVMQKHGCTKDDLIELLQSDPTGPVKRRKRATTATRKRRQLKIFKNPKTGETVETRGGNHRVLKAWKERYKIKNIDDWLIETKH